MLSSRRFPDKKGFRETVEEVNHFFHAEWGGDSYARRHTENPYTNLGGIPVDGGGGGDRGRCCAGRRASSYGDWSESYYVFQSYWTEELTAHIYGRTWPVRWGKEGQKQLIKVFSNGEKAELFFKRRKPGHEKPRLAGFSGSGTSLESPFA